MARRVSHRRRAAFLVIAITLVALGAIAHLLDVRRRAALAHRTAIERLDRMGGRLIIGNRRGDWLVSLDNTETDDAALAELVASLKYCPVDDLSLRNTKITNDGLQSVALLWGLGSLDISGTKVTDDGLQHLVGVKTLWRIDTENTRVTERGRAQLRKSLRFFDIYERQRESYGP